MEEDIVSRAKEVLVKLNLDGKRKTIREIEAESTHPDFWKDSQAAAKKMKQMAALQKELEDGEMLELLIEDGNAAELEKTVGRFEFALYLPALMTEMMRFLPFTPGREEQKRWIGRVCLIECIHAT